jgi:hypothetical protein
MDLRAYCDGGRYLELKHPAPLHFSVCRCSENSSCRSCRFYLRQSAQPLAFQLVALRSTRIKQFKDQRGKLDREAEIARALIGVGPLNNVLLASCVNRLR